MLIEFSKMQAQGNDFVIVDLMDGSALPPRVEELAEAICDRRFGVGADGLVFLLDDPAADFRMRIYNSDGSLAMMCGSALRCCAWLGAVKLDKDELLIATESGMRSAWLSHPVVYANLGKAEILGTETEISGIKGSVVDVGNLHFISWWESLESNPHLQYGGSIEEESLQHFPQGVNAMFAKVISPQQLDLKIWERGCGATLACGTGAVSTVKAGINQGLLEGEIKVNMPGGSVSVSQTADHDLILGGGVEEVFRGVYPWKI